MLIYSIVIIFAFISSIYAFSKNNSTRIFFVTAAAISLIICFGYMCGSDWRSYEMWYDSYKEPGNFYWRFTYVEPLYLVTNIIGNELGLNFWVYYILLKLLIYWKICSIFYKYSPPSTLLVGFTFYLGFWGILNFIDPSFRNMLAVFVFLCGIDFLVERNFTKYCIIVIIATLFHSSAMFLIVMYFLINKKWTNQQLIVCFIILNIITLKPDIIFKSLGLVFSSVDVFSAKIENYTTGDESNTTGAGKIFSFGYFMHILFFTMIIYCRNNIEKMRHGQFLFNVAILFPFIFRLGLVVLIFSRLQLYFSFFYAIVIGACVMYIVKKQRLLYITCLFLLSLYSVKGQMASVLFTPYSNILMYLDRDYSYDYRSEYNYRNSPYKLK